MAEEYDVIIVGAGLSGLSAAFFLGKHCPGWRVVLLESASRPGGAVATFREGNYQAEWGPHGFLNNVAESREILADTGLDREMQTAPLGEFHRFICHRGQLVPLPQNPKMLLTTPLLSLPGKLRLLADLWKTPRPEDQAIGAWAAYRFGRGVLPMVDVAVTGTFAGDLDRLSIDAVMPGVRQLEKEHGSVLRGLKHKKGVGSNGIKSLPAMVNFPRGMERLIEVLAANRDIRLEMPVAAVRPTASGWQVTTAAGEIQGSRLLMALPVNPALQLLTPLSSPPVSVIPGARIANVVLVFGPEARVPRGFGYLAPESEKRFALGGMFSSHMFSGRCPTDEVMVEALVGGRRHPERVELPDEEMVARVYKDLAQLIHLPRPPRYAKVLRSAGEIPQLEMGHPGLLQWRRRLEGKESGLQICGFGWDGIGMNDMIKSAAKAVAALEKGQGEEGAAAPVKPVYF
jgi:oxygen-dependent protoporphyrinogen oxidase